MTRQAQNTIQGVALALIILVLYMVAAAMDEARQPVCAADQLEVQA